MFPTVIDGLQNGANIVATKIAHFSDGIWIITILLRKEHTSFNKIDD